MQVTLWVLTVGALRLSPYVAGIKVSPFALTTAAYSRPTNSCSWVGTISESKIPTHLIVRAQCLSLPSQRIFCFLFALETDSQPLSGTTATPILKALCDLYLKLRLG